MDPSGRAGVQGTVHAPAVPATPSQSSAPFLRGRGAHACRDRKPVTETNERRDHTQAAGFPIHAIPRSQERRRSEAGNTSKVLEQIRAHRPLQNGGHPRLERPAKTRRLDAKVDLKDAYFMLPIREETELSSRSHSRTTLTSSSV